MRSRRRLARDSRGPINRASADLATQILAAVQTGAVFQLYLAETDRVIGSPVQRWIDASGKGGVLGGGTMLDVSQTTPANRPTYIASAFTGIDGVRFDGVDDILSTINGNTLTASAKRGGAMIGLFQDTTAAVNVISEYSPNISGNTGAMAIAVNETVAGRIGSYSGGSPFTTSAAFGASSLASATVITATLDRTLTLNATRIRADGVDITSGYYANADVADFFGDYSVFLGARSGPTVPWAGTMGAWIFCLWDDSVANHLSEIQAVENILIGLK